MNTDKIKVVFVETRQKIRNEAMPLKAWIVFVFLVDFALFALKAKDLILGNYK